MNTETFLRPRLVGRRFEGHAIPLEFLKDLAVLEEMIVEIAKWKYRNDNPDRKRIPCGFMDGIELKLTGIEEGSAIPVISLLVAASTLFPLDNQVYYEKARDAIICAIDAAEQDKTITDYLPDTSLVYFDRIGRSLRDKEAIEFTTPIQMKTARLTKETRRKLILASTTVTEITEETTIRGLIPEADQHNLTFQIQMLDGRKIKAPMESQHRKTILEAFIGYKNGVRVLLHGVGKFTRQEKIQSFESIEYISILDPMDIPARLDELRNLQDGWLEGKGLAPKSDELDWISKTFENNYPDDELPLPFIYPTTEGGIQAEWQIESYDASLEINLQTHHAGWHCYSIETDEEDFRNLDLNNSDDWKWLRDKIRTLV